jgi:hypothetical protein
MSMWYPHASGPVAPCHTRVRQIIVTEGLRIAPTGNILPPFGRRQNTYITCHVMHSAEGVFEYASR